MEMKVKKIFVDRFSCIQNKKQNFSDQKSGRPGLAGSIGIRGRPGPRGLKGLMGRPGLEGLKGFPGIVWFL